MPTLTEMAEIQRANENDNAIAITAQRLRESGKLGQESLAALDAFQQALRDYRAALADAQRACRPATETGD